MDVNKWVIDWFENNGECGGELHLDESYFELGYIDSFKFIILLAAIQDEFNIRFDNDRFQDRSFSTINGLIRAIEGQIAG